MRKSGVLMHISSLPSPHGIGAMGKAARDFVDFLKAGGQSCWQLLPICPTGYGDSPYQSFSTFAGNPYFIDLDELEADGLLSRSEYESIDWESAPDTVNYGALYRKRFPVLRLAVRRLLDNPLEEYGDFCRENGAWLNDYALFMALKDANGGRPFREWPEPLLRRDEGALRQAEADNAGDTAFWRGVQFLFFRQWRALKTYANDSGISLIGDCPIYVSPDSADLWAKPSLFRLDESLAPTEVAGCPPDGFSADGQLWGNPLYDWERMAKDDYSWWVDRIGYLCGVYDTLRIDHFRGFDSYYAIPFGSVDAKHGVWRKGPGLELFRAAERRLGRQDIIAEDLGFLTDSVRKLLADSGYPGMKVLEFAFDHRDSSGGNVYLPHLWQKRSVAYIGTHDNNTALGWLGEVDPNDRAYAERYFNLTEDEGLNWGMMRGLWASVAELTVVQAQDLLGLGGEGRMNTPSTTGGNWCWRALPDAFDEALAARLRLCMQTFGRLPRE